MKITVDGKEIECDELRLTRQVGAVDGITEESDLEIRFTSEGLIMDLVEVTDRCTGSSAEVTRTFSNTFDELTELLK